MAIQVGSVEVDVVPNTRGIYAQLRAGLVPAATRAGEDAGAAAGRSFGPAMQRQVGDVGLRIGEEIGQQIATRLTASLRDSVRDGVNQAGRTARPAATRQGDETAGAFSRALRTRLEAAFRALPRLTIDADTSEADSDLQALRFRMETLANQRIGIDIEATDARAEIRLIEAELTRLGASHPNVQVRADTARALAELGAVHAAIDAVDGKRARIDVDTAGATSAVLHLAVAIGGLAALPAIPVLAAGIGAIGSAAIAAGVGVGALAAVAIPAFVGIAGALQAQKAAQDAATASSLKGAQAASQGAAQVLQMAGAQQALAAAERNGARQVAQAQQQVRQARVAAADAVVQAAERNAQAARAIEDAERSLARSQKDAKRAQEDLTDARREAAQELEDLNSRLAGAELSQRDAVLGVKEAQAELNATMRDASASQIDKDRAQLAYDQAVQRLKEQSTETKRLKQETTEANRAGIEGSDTVRSAQERLADAQQEVADKSRAVRDAQIEAARTQVETARQIAQAQERVGEATANVAQAQQSAAEAVASAQRQIASASLSAAGGIDQAALAQAKYQAALDKLSPSARATFDAFQSLRTMFKAWSTALQPQVMPIFTRALEGLKNSLPGLTPFVMAAARAIGDLQDRVSRGFKSPWWLQFKKDLAGSVYPALIGFGVGFGRIFKGAAGIVQAFLPHMDSISQRMQDITGRFATWGTGLKGSEKFERFLAYASKQGPILAGVLGDIGSALYQIAKAAAPLSGPVLTALGAVASALASIAETLPWLIQLMYAAWVVTKLWTLAMIAFNLVLAANPITLIIIGIVALVAAVVYAYKHFGWFRDTVQAVWAGIQVAAKWAWENVLKPVFAALVVAFKVVAAAAVWLWQTILKPVFTFIADAAAILATVVLTILIAPLVLAFKALAAVAEWLWNNVLAPAFKGIAKDATWLWQTILKPVFQAIAAALRWLWENVAKPVFEHFKRGFKQLGEVAKWVWGNALQPVLGWIGDKANWLWQRALKPAFANIKTGIESVGKSFDSARGFIDQAWSKIADIAKKPVRFIIDKIYNAGIVPTWNLIAKAFGAPAIEKMETKGWARGGILPGQSSFRQGDDQLVPMRRGEGVYVSEAMRDPYERARLHAVNRAAMAGKPLDQYQGFARGGIFDWVGDATSKVVDLAQTGASWLKDGVKASATAGLNSVVEPLIKRISGSASLYRDMVTGIPRKIVKTIVGFSGEADERLEAAGIGGGGFTRGLSWARTQAGLPYQWGGNGNPSWDCSGLVSAIESVIRGQTPHRRWATGAFSGKTAPPGWVLNGRSPYRIGITNAGVGHTAGTINGVNVESRGGDGVVIGKGARAWNDKLFTHHYAYQGTFDSGGYLQPGLNLAYNGTGRPEPVFTMAQANALTRAASQGPGGLQPGDALALVVDGHEFTAYVDDRANLQVSNTLMPAIAAARAGRKG
ncbi:MULTISPECIES: hypothetical protein [Streptomyces]|uniref:Uncharacterized protein n=1 Tax=Streptomyces venezuelae (strain ATCC 10712 / CBS 650.69 / DSM 40230 / JCM 4526 / NBRC 13096 / PD 04745) TaxID=953739 RepID=F2R0S4_STRVP|nr:hypothetical protein [Streptomyces venezuelae]APE21416.1 hypothetical protein vnz_10525 [Streptomyces venezuelae]QER98804.1 hypothetical protein DEJ43_10670 [Streptomyces venezuelae ATCC 10712]CCA55441.1 hypothetical protein SVEN_2155 [Streptomyces venezuelae ATCC 10712]